MMRCQRDQSFPKKKKVKAIIGPYLSHEALEKLVEGMPRNEAYRLITLVVEQMVRKLKHGVDTGAGFDSRSKSMESREPT